jgi:hypothetical protein
VRCIYALNPQQQFPLVYFHAGMPGPTMHSGKQVIIEEAWSVACGVTGAEQCSNATCRSEEQVSGHERRADHCGTAGPGALCYPGGWRLARCPLAVSAADHVCCTAHRCCKSRVFISYCLNHLSVTGMHSEGGVWATLWGLLMWPVLFADVPEVCPSPLLFPDLTFRYPQVASWDCPTVLFSRLSHGSRCFGRPSNRRPWIWARMPSSQRGRRLSNPASRKSGEMMPYAEGYSCVAAGTVFS